MKAKKNKKLFKNIVILSFFAYFMVTTLNLNANIALKKEEVNNLQNQISRYVKQNQKLINMIKLDNTTYIEKIARDKLGFISQSELIFYDVND